MLDIQQIATQLQAVRFGLLTRDFIDIVYDPGKHPRDSHGRYIGGDHAAKSVAHQYEAAHLKTWLAQQKAYAKTLPTPAAQKAHLKGLTYKDAKGQQGISAHIKQLLATADTHAGQMTLADAQELGVMLHVYSRIFHVDPEMQQHLINTLKAYNKAQTNPQNTILLTPAGLRNVYYQGSEAVIQPIFNHTMVLPYVPSVNRPVSQPAARPTNRPVSPSVTTKPKSLTYLTVKEKKAVIFILGRQFTNEDVQKLYPGMQIVEQKVTIPTKFSRDQRTIFSVRLGASQDTFSSLDLEFIKYGGTVTAHVVYAENLTENAAYAGRVIIRSMQHFQAMGMTRITAEAARSRHYNGYYTWARLGFTGTIPHDVLPAAQAKFGDVTNVQDIMAKPGGAAWWKQNGSTFNATFDFASGSHSRQVFDRLVQGIANRVRLAQLRRRLLAIQEVG